MAALLLDQWCLHTFQCLSKILSPNRRRRKGASSIGRCLHPPIPTTSGKIWKCIFFYWLESIHHFLCTLAHPAGGFAYTKDLWLSFLLVLCKSSFFLQHTLHWLGEFNCLKTNTCQLRHNFILASSCPDSTQYTGWSSSFFIALKFVCWHGRLWLSASTAIGSKYKHIWHQQRLRCKNWCYIYGVKNICAN